MFNETNLKPEYSYTIIVSVRNRNVDALSLAVRDRFDAPAGSKYDQYETKSRILITAPISSQKVRPR